MAESTLVRNEYQRQRAMELSSWSDNFRMMSTRDLFYGKNEPTFILKNIKGVPPRPEMVLSSVPFYPSVAQNDDKGKKGAEEKKKDPDVVLYVPMCCRECEDRVKVGLSGIEGVKSVECNWYKRRVIVSGKALNSLPILLKCRTIFKKSAIWNDD